MKPYFDYEIGLQNIGIARYQQGMMLYDIENQPFALRLKFSDLLALRYSIYLLDATGATLRINEFGARICGFHTPDNAIGKTIFDVSIGKTSNILLDNCRSVLEQESVEIFDESSMRYDGRVLQFLSIKFPCYSSQGQLQGTLGISIVLGEHSLAKAITELTTLGLLPKDTNSQDQTIKLNLGGVSLTPREKECLEYAVRGFIAKDIAKKLSISPRTVEDYINQIKLKLGVFSKQQMIQKVTSN